MAGDEFTREGVTLPTKDLTTMVKLIKDLVDRLNQQDAANKVTNDRLDVIAAGVMLPAADNNKHETAGHRLF
ncbi:hypothetical protein F2Q69_00046459 [Brassica cretica]|uniref:Uncharacterized protein n=1 Tax=Brassica cretica TaxID=69181 RepID=A0A8S9PU96_BRACR|nr:hypothetical protein F2Q69_00046459 [Brassica cretica]